MGTVRCFCEAARVRDEGLNDFLIGIAVLRQSVIKQPPALLKPRVHGFSRPLMARGHGGVQAEDLKQERFLSLTQMKQKVGFGGSDQFHPSRSIVACRVYF
jgi:hypothetical protein